MNSIQTFALAGLLAASLLLGADAFAVQLKNAFDPGEPGLISLNQSDATGEKQCFKGGLPSGARVRCIFHRIEGKVTSEGLWLTYMASNSAKWPFRIIGTRVGRVTSVVQSSFSPHQATDTWARLDLPLTGTVEATQRIVRFARPGVVEEYSVSVDGVRQDFIIERRPRGEGELVLELAASGAKLEPVVNGVRLVLAGTGCTVAYNRMRVTDATGRELSARIVIGSETSCLPDSAVSEAGPEISPDPPGVSRAATMLAIVVNDNGAVYPVRIDPTFSDDNWTTMGGIPGVNGSIRVATSDGSGNLYVGGDFTIVGRVYANHIAKWNGSSWLGLGSGMNDDVYALAVSGSDLYAGGIFTNAGGVPVNHIAKWNGTTWSPVGSGMEDWVGALAVSGSDLYAGGGFTTAGGTAANFIAKWNGTSWSPLGSGMNMEVTALAMSGDQLFAGGFFTTAGGVTANYVAKWDGGNWSELGCGMGSTQGGAPVVFALAVSGGTLYAGGYFNTAGCGPANYIAKWNGSFWSPVGSGMNGFVFSLAASGVNVYAGGYFTDAGGVGTNHIAKWNGSSWSPLSSGVNNVVRAVAVTGSDLYAGGLFSTAGNTAATRLAKWNGSNWSSPTPGINTNVYAIAVSGSDMYVGGHFIRVSGIAANYVAKWNGRTWSPLGSGMNGPVYALAVLGSEIYAGGEFTTAGGVQANCIAKWNGSNWSALGSGMDIGPFDNPGVYALAPLGTNLYAGGYFLSAGGVGANNVAKWNGSSWSALDLGVNSYVWALAASGTDLYAGGRFSRADGNLAICIAKWNGNSWSPLGQGMSGDYPFVYSLAVSESDLYAGGHFVGAGDVPARYIAKWDGSSWSAVGSGTDGTAYALQVFGSDLYAGGTNSSAGGGYAVRWNGTSWSPLGSGASNPVRALGVLGNELFVGGEFETVGGKVSAYLARARIGCIAGSPMVSNSTTSIKFSGVTGYEYDVQRATNLGPPITWTIVNGNPLTPASDGSFSFTDTNAPPGMGYYAPWNVEPELSETPGEKKVKKMTILGKPSRACVLFCSQRNGARSNPRLTGMKSFLLASMPL